MKLAKLYRTTFLKTSEATAAGRSYRQILTVIWAIILKIAFPKFFSCKRLCTGCPVKGVDHCSFCKVL